MRIGRDDYLGTPEEVLGFMMRAEGAPAREPEAYMEGIALRLAQQLHVTSLPTDDPEAFLLALSERRLIRLESLGEPSAERSDPREVLGDGPVTFGKGVRDDDVPHL